MEFGIKQKSEGNKGRFYLEKGAQGVAHVDYRMEDDQTLVVERTEVIPSFRGTKVGRQLVDKILSLAESENLKIKSECSYFSHQMEKM